MPKIIIDMPTPQLQEAMEQKINEGVKCYGSTVDSKSTGLGSIPSTPAKIIETVPQYILEHFLDHIVPSLSWMSDVDTHVEGLYMFRTPSDYHTEELFLELCRDRWERYNMPNKYQASILRR